MKEAREAHAPRVPEGPRRDGGGGGRGMTGPAWKNEGGGIGSVDCTGGAAAAATVWYEGGGGVLCCSRDSRWSRSSTLALREANCELLTVGESAQRKAKRNSLELVVQLGKLQVQRGQ